MLDVKEELEKCYKELFKTKCYNSCVEILKIMLNAGIRKVDETKEQGETKND